MTGGVTAQAAAETRSRTAAHGSVCPLSVGLVSGTLLWPLFLFCFSVV